MNSINEIYVESPLPIGFRSVGRGVSHREAGPRHAGGEGNFRRTNEFYAFLQVIGIGCELFLVGTQLFGIFSLSRGLSAMPGVVIKFTIFFVDIVML